MKLHHMLLNKEGADKGGGGDALSKAIADMAEAPRVQGKSAQGEKLKDGDGEDPPKKKVQRQPKDGDDDDTSGDSVIADALRNAKGDDRKDDDDKGEDDKALTPEQKKAKEESDKSKPKDTYDKDLGDLNERGVSPNVGTKFKRLKEEAITKLREKDTALEQATAKIKELEGKAPQGSLAPEEFEKHPEVVKLKATLQQQHDLIEKIRLEESPTFKKAFDEKINEYGKKVIPILKTITDEKVRMKTAQAVDAIMRIEAGEEGDEKFFSKLGEIMEDSGLNAVQQGRVIMALETARDLTNQREGKLTNWKESSKEFASQEQATRQESVKATLGAFEAARSTYNNALSDKIGLFRKHPEAFGYDQTVTPFFEKAKAEIAKSAETGALTPDLIRFVNAGVDAPFYMKLTENLQSLASAKNKEIADLKEELESLRAKDPSKGSRENGTRRNGFRKAEDDGDGDDADDRGSVLGKALRRTAGVR